MQNGKDEKDTHYTEIFLYKFEIHLTKYSNTCSFKRF